MKLDPKHGSAKKPSLPWRIDASSHANDSLAFCKRDRVLTVGKGQVRKWTNGDQSQGIGFGNFELVKNLLMRRPLGKGVQLF